MASFELKEAGNIAFKAGKYGEAKLRYEEALKAADTNQLRSTLYANLAACSLKLQQFDQCILECDLTLDLDPVNVKALYRRALSYFETKNHVKCHTDLQRLLKLEPNNQDSLQLMRKVKEILQDKNASSTEVQKWMNRLEESKTQLDALKALVELCLDDPYHSIDFARRKGVSIIHNVLIQHEVDGVFATNDIAIRCLRMFAILTNHKLLMQQYFTLESQPSSSVEPQHISIDFVCNILSKCRHIESITPALLLLMNTLKFIPPSADFTDKTLCTAIEEGNIKLEDDIFFTLSLTHSKLIAQTLISLLQQHVINTPIYALIADSLAAFVSSYRNYYDAYDPTTPSIDTRLESLQQRRLRVRYEYILHKRAKLHATLCLEDFQIMTIFICTLEGDFCHPSTVSLLGKLLHSYDNIERTQSLLLPYLTPFESRSFQKVTQSLTRVRLEAALLQTIPDPLGIWALSQNLGSAAHILGLIATGAQRCVEAAAELLCLAAPLEPLAPLLRHLQEEGALDQLVRSPIATVKAAATSALTKLSLKEMKATSGGGGSISISQQGGQTEGTGEQQAQLRNEAQVIEQQIALIEAARTVLRQHLLPATAASTEVKQNDNKLVSFSSHDITSTSTTQQQTPLQPQQQANYAAVERAIESLAALSSITPLKQAMVHGSTANSSIISSLTALSINNLSPSARLGIAHLFSQLTVTQRELMSIALADKEISIEQYEQLQELQRIKGAKDDHGNVLEEKPSAKDNDTNELCNMRIRKIVQDGGVLCLVQILQPPIATLTASNDKSTSEQQGQSQQQSSSQQSRELTCRTLRQICVADQSRGLFIQQGGLKICSQIAVTSSTENTAVCRREAAHAVAKAMVTTNPHILSEHQRLATIRPLLLLCREVDSTNLQQFEALLALTNLLSVGEAEQEKFSAEKGVASVHYLMFSSHLMVRRAATEALCNMPCHESMLRLLRKRDQLRLWLGFAEDWQSLTQEEAEGKASEAAEAISDADKQEQFKTSCAAAGTLAMAAMDSEVTQALIAEDVAKTIVHLLETAHPELVHRALALTCQLMEHDGRDAAQHLATGSLLPALGIVAPMNRPEFIEMAREVAIAIGQRLDMPIVS